MSNVEYHRDSQIVIVAMRRVGERDFDFDYMGEAIKPKRFGQAEKDAFATLYAQCDKIVLIQRGHKKNRLGGGGFRSVTWFTDYIRQPDGKWIKVRATSRTDK